MWSGWTPIIFNGGFLLKIVCLRWLFFLFIFWVHFAWQLAMLKFILVIAGGLQRSLKQVGTKHWDTWRKFAKYCCRSLFGAGLLQNHPKKRLKLISFFNPFLVMFLDDKTFTCSAIGVNINSSIEHHGLFRWSVCVWKRWELLQRKICWGQFLTRGALGLRCLVACLSCFSPLWGWRGVCFPGHTVGIHTIPNSWVMRSSRIVGFNHELVFFMVSWAWSKRKPYDRGFLLGIWTYTFQLYMNYNKTWIPDPIFNHPALINPIYFFCTSLLSRFQAHRQTINFYIPTIYIYTIYICC